MKKIPELLAPAGGPEQLRAAVENGADAVYLGGTAFNARMNAGNFDEAALREGVEYAHLRGCAIHVTLNTLLQSRELPEAVKQAASLYEGGVDAFIVQDLGFGRLLKKHFPHMVLHLSTQGTVYNLEGVKRAADLGFSRVVLARELSLSEIRAITAATDMEIEVFIHGALCMCYSGQCQMSRVIGGRSGNRGACAQPCRLGYEILQAPSGEGVSSPEGLKAMGSGYLLSPKDLCTIDLLDQLAEAGVASLKIEGRMKSPEYVAVVTGIYRKYLDEYRETGSCSVTPEDRGALNQIFSRGTFTEGYLTGNPRKDLLSGDLPKHQGVLLGEVLSYNPRRRTAVARLTGKLSLGDGVELRNEELSGNIITYLKGNEIGYLSGNISPGDAIYKISDKELMEQARASYQGRSGTERKGMRKCSVAMELFVRVGKPAVLKAQAGKICVEGTSETVGEQALSRPLDLETVKKQMDKTGDTPFRLAELQLDTGGEQVSMKLSALNELRRMVLADLEERFLQDSAGGRSPEPEQVRRAVEDARDLAVEAAQPGEEAGSQGNREKQEKIKLSYYIFDADMETLQLCGKAFREIPGLGKFPVERFYLPYELFLSPEYTEALKELVNRGKEIVPFLPSVTRGREDLFLQENMERLKEAAVQYGISVGNLAQAQLFTEAGAKVYGDFGFNFCNTADIALAAELGLSGTVVSNEAVPGSSRGMDRESDPESEDLFDFPALAKAAEKRKIRLEAAVGGAVPLMISAHCPIGDMGKGCPGCSGLESSHGSGGSQGGKGVCDSGTYYLKDRKKQLYRILTRKRDCQMLLFQNKTAANVDFTRYIAENGIVNLRFYGVDKNIFCEQA